MDIERKYDTETEVVENERGGKQSKLEMRFDLIDTNATFRLARVLHKGCIRYQADNWRKLTVEDNLNRALYHLMAYKEKRRKGTHLEGEDDLGHAFCRVMFAIGIEAEEGS